MALNIYEIIRGPWVTSKAYMLNQALKQLVLEVHPHANKPMIVEALKKLFNVETEHIQIVTVNGKMRRAGRSHVRGKKRKKVVVTLKDGYNVDLAGWTPSAEGANSAIKV